jgi:hypothetical protein
VRRALESLPNIGLKTQRFKPGPDAALPTQKLSETRGQRARCKIQLGLIVIGAIEICAKGLPEYGF